MLDKRQPLPDESECVNQHADIRLALVRRMNGHAQRTCAIVVAIEKEPTSRKVRGEAGSVLSIDKEIYISEVWLGAYLCYRCRAKSFHR